MSANVTHTGVFHAFRLRKEDGFTLGTLADGTVIVGRSEDGELVPGLTYLFHGKWADHPQYGRQFRFTQFLQQVPHGRDGIVAYLCKYAPGIGEHLAHELFQRYGSDTVRVLRTQPESVAAMAAGQKLGRHLPLDKCRRVAEALEEVARYEDTIIDLTNLFQGRGFPGVLVGECLKKWGIHAPAIIRRDPFRLLVEQMSGCGFSRCDRLYRDLGLPLDRLKRQLICLWHAIREDMSGDTWLPLDRIGQLFQQRISGTENGADGLGPDLTKALRLGVRAGWLAVRGEEDRQWVAIGERARQEAELAEWIKQMSTPTNTIPSPPNGCEVCEPVANSLSCASTSGA